MFNRGGIIRVRPIPCKFPHKMALVTCPCAFRLRRLEQTVGRGRGIWHFPCKFPCKMALVKCSCVFRLRRLAQNGCRGISVPRFSCKCPHKMALVTCPCAFRLRGHMAFSLQISIQNAPVKCSCVFRRRRLAQKGCRGISVPRFSCKCPHKMSPVKCPCAFRPRRLAQNETSHTEILPTYLLEGASTEILPGDLLWRS